MFGRKKHIAVVEQSSVQTTTSTATTGLTQLSDEAVFAIVQARLLGFFGAGGDWTVVRRTGAETDVFFHELFAHAVATTITSSLTAALDLGSLPSESGVTEPDVLDTLAALPWAPEPITVWADLKRPVTGPLAVVGAA